MELRNTHFSHTLGDDAIEQFITTPELSDDLSRGLRGIPTS